jgi:hypothetical protein
MRVRGIVQSAELQDDPAGGDRVEMLLRVQGVGPDQPRRLVVPFAVLVDDTTLDPDALRGRGFEAEVGQDEGGRWVVGEIRVLGLKARL